MTNREVWSQAKAPAITGAAAGTAVVMVLVGFALTFALSRLGAEPGLGNRSNPPKERAVSKDTLPG